MWQDRCKEFVDAVIHDHEAFANDDEYAASILMNYIEELPDEKRHVMLDFVHCLSAMAETIDPVEDEYCYCCGRRSVEVQPCPQCGELVCQDCAPPSGGHVCESE